MEELCAPQPLAKQVLCQAGEQKWKLVTQRLPVGSQPGQGGEDAGGAAQVASQRPHLSLQEHGEARWTAVARSQNSLSRPTVGSSSSCSFPLFLRLPRPFVSGEAGQAPDFASVPQPSTHTQSSPRLHPLKLLQPGPASAVGSLPPPPTPSPSSATLLPFAAPCNPPL